MAADLMLIVYTSNRPQLTFTGEIDLYTATFSGGVITNGNPTRYTQAQWNAGGALAVGVYGIRSGGTLMVEALARLTTVGRTAQKDPWPDPPPEKTSNFWNLTPAQWSSMTDHFMVTAG
jgi:hypothetical protein